MTAPHITFRVRRGTQEQIMNSQMSVYEMAYATDSSALFVVDYSGTRQFIGQAMRARLSQRPDPGVGGRFFYATDVEELFVDNITTWKPVSFVDEHSFLGDRHTFSGLEEGQYLRASAEDACSFEYIIQDDLPDIDSGVIAE